jgi:hypothetical protein
MFIKLLTYLHFNGLHGNVKYYKYLFEQMDFDNQLINQIRNFRQTILWPILTDCNTYKMSVDNEKLVQGIIKGMCCIHRRTNPYVREVQLATEYLFDVDLFSAEHRNDIRSFILENYKHTQKMDDYLDFNQITIQDYEYEEMLNLLVKDYKDLLCLENKYF